MAAKDGIENEVKFRIGDTRPVEEKLRSAGAKLIESGLERNIRYGNDFLRKSKDLLRLRSYGGSAVVTHKRKLASVKEYKVREETEITVSSFESARKILEAIGFEKAWIYEKKRQVWVLDGVEVLIDELPLIGNFVEIEGSNEEIERTAGKLGFDMKGARTTSYTEEYTEWRKANHLPKEDLVFPENKK